MQLANAVCCLFLFFFFFKQKTAYEISTRDWSSDVCSSDLNDQIQAYRDKLSLAQNQFLTALKTTVPTAQLQSVAVKDPAGNVAGNVQLRYSLVYNGVTLTVPAAAVPLIANMSGVKAVHPNTVSHPTLFKSVPYIRAPQLYGHN